MLTGAGLAAAPLLLAQSPAEAGGLFSVPSTSDQKKVGEEAAKQVIKDNKEVFDSRATHFKTIGERLVSALSPHDQTTWDYKFHVLESKELNAFALPGGNMFMYTALYEKMTSDDAIAGVTGHEMTHVRLQHWAKAYAAEQKRQIGILALVMVFKMGSGVQNVISLADSAVGLKFSRHDEQQADSGGLQNMVDAGYNPQGMIDLFKVLEKAAGDGSTLGGDFLSDHPKTSDRIKAAQKMIDQLSQTRTFPPLTPFDYKSLYVDPKTLPATPTKGK
jgi:predicted Zn-dependent protease